MPQFSKLIGCLHPEEQEVVRGILADIGLTPEDDASKMNDKTLEAFVRLLVEREVSKDRRRRVAAMLRNLLEESGNPVARKFGPRVPLRTLPPKERRRNFEEVVKVYSWEEGVKEAQRCLTCKNPRCVDACPVHLGVPAMFRLQAQGKLDAAYKLALSYYPCLGITGRICVRFCEYACIMNEIGMEPLAIRASHRFIADNVDRRKIKPTPKPPTGKKVAIVGSGPAGITAAYHLALMGHSVTVFEASDRIGGMLSLAIPEFRLPYGVVEEQLSLVKELGVRFELGRRVGDDFKISNLLKEYDAVFISVGAHKPRTMKIPGEDLEGVMQALNFLYEAKRGKLGKMSGKVWVIGGGDVAMDAARTALRLGAEEVKIMYRRSKVEMPADEEQVRDAEAEGIEVIYLAAPIELIGENGRLRKMKCVRMRLGEPGPDGRRRPEPIPDSEFEVEADYVIEAIGQRPDVSWISRDDGIEVTDWGTIKVDENMETTRPGIFAGGDAVRGPATAIEAIADGKKAAESIDRYLKSKSS